MRRRNAVTAVYGAVPNGLLAVPESETIPLQRVRLPVRPDRKSADRVYAFVESRVAQAEENCRFGRAATRQCGGQNDRTDREREILSHIYIYCQHSNRVGTMEIQTG